MHTSTPPFNHQPLSPHHQSKQPLSHLPIIPNKPHRPPIPPHPPPKQTPPNLTIRMKHHPRPPRLLPHHLRPPRRPQPSHLTPHQHRPPPKPPLHPPITAYRPTNSITLRVPTPITKKQHPLPRPHPRIPKPRRLHQRPIHPLLPIPNPHRPPHSRPPVVWGYPHHLNRRLHNRRHRVPTIPPMPDRIPVNLPRDPPLPGAAVNKRSRVYRPASLQRTLKRFRVGDIRPQRPRPRHRGADAMQRCLLFMLSREVQDVRILPW